MGSSPGKNTGPGVSTRRGSRPGQCVLYQLSPAEETDRQPEPGLGLGGFRESQVTPDRLSVLRGFVL